METAMPVAKRHRIGTPNQAAQRGRQARLDPGPYLQPKREFGFAVAVKEAGAALFGNRRWLGHRWFRR